MAKMGDSVIQDKEKKKIEEEIIALRYQQERDRQDQLDNEARLRRNLEYQEELRKTLDQQILEKKIKINEEKRDARTQADIWKKDQEITSKEEKEIEARVKQTNKEYEEELKKQMDDQKRKKRDGMNQEEYLMNKKFMSKIEKNPK